MAAADSAEAVQRQFDDHHRQTLETCSRELGGLLSAVAGTSAEGPVRSSVATDGTVRRILEPLVPPRQIVERLTLEARYDVVIDRQRSGFLGISPIGVGFGKRFDTSTSSSTTLRIEVTATPISSSSAAVTAAPGTPVPGAPDPASSKP